MLAFHLSAAFPFTMPHFLAFERSAHSNRAAISPEDFSACDLAVSAAGVVALLGHSAIWQFSTATGELLEYASTPGLQKAAMGPAGCDLQKRD